jgi:hypothetical protein
LLQRSLRGQWDLGPTRFARASERLDPSEVAGVNQLRHGPDLHLRHGSAAMHFHGFQGNTHVGSELPVQTAADDVVHHLALAQRQGGDASQDFLAFLLPDTGRRVARDRILYR